MKKIIKENRFPTALSICDFSKTILDKNIPGYQMVHIERLGLNKNEVIKRFKYSPDTLEKAIKESLRKD